MHTTTKIHNRIHLDLEPTIQYLDQEYAKNALLNRPKTTDSRHLFRAVIEDGVSILGLLQSRNPQPFAPKTDTGWIVVLCDRYVRTEDALGFHEESLKEVFRKTDQVSIITWNPADSLFICSATTAGKLKKRAVVIETLQEKKWFWMSYAMGVNQNICFDIGDD